jgi:hypothetical protein
MMKTLGLTMLVLGMALAVVVCDTTKSTAQAQEAGIRGETGASTPADAAARMRFLEIERFARLPDDQQAKAFAAFYRDTAPRHLNSVVLMILSSAPADILDRQQRLFLGGDPNERWAQQLQIAATTLTPEQVADKLGTRLWLDIGSYVRTRQTLQQRPEALATLVKQDLEAKEFPAVERACRAIRELHLTQFTDKLLALYLSDTPLSKPTHTALIWLKDPVILRPLLEDIEKDPKTLARHAGLLQGLLAGKAAEPLLLKLLDSPDAEEASGAGGGDPSQREQGDHPKVKCKRGGTQA